MKGQGGGGTARGGGKNRSGGGAVKVTKAKARETKAIEDNILKLRASIFDTNGRDKNVTLGIAPAFMKYERNGLDLSIEFATTKLNNEEADWAFDLVKESMEERYDASGYGWDDEDKERELTENGARFLIVREWPENDKVKGDLVAFAHFRFTVQGEVVDQMAGEPQLLIFDLHVEDHSQRKGLGKHLLIVLELIARREKMSFISIPVQLGDNVTKSWLEKSGRGFSVDPLTNISGFDAEVEGFEVYSKSLEAPKPKPVEPVPTATATTTAAATEKAVEGPVGESKISSEDNNKASSSGNVFNFSSLTATLTEPSSGSEETSAENSSGVENEEEVIAQLTVLFAEKHGRQPTPDEVALWVDSIRSIDTDDIPTNNTTTEGEDKEDGDGDNSNNSNSNKALPVEDDWVHV